MQRSTGRTIELRTGDITQQDDIDIVVNAANAQLRPGGGVAGAIHKAAGPELEEACTPLAPIQPGEAVITDAYSLPNKRVIHCLGPRYPEDEPTAELLASCYENALRLADQEGHASIAFPAISTGIFGYPLKEAADVAIGTVARMFVDLKNIKKIRFVLFDDEARAVFEKALAKRLAT
jgi:O-acetyl-ADP-ribose deacetylase